MAEDTFPPTEQALRRFESETLHVSGGLDREILPNQFYYSITGFFFGLTISCFCLGW